MTEKIADVVPIGIPPRSVMWRRHQLAKSLLSHRELTKETAELVVAALDGEFEPVWDDRRGAL